MRIDNRSEMVRSRFTMDTSDFDKFGGALVFCFYCCYLATGCCVEILLQILVEITFRLRRVLAGLIGNQL